LAAGAVEFVQASIEAIDPDARAVRSDRWSWEADFLVVALGAEPRPELRRRDGRVHVRRLGDGGRAGGESGARRCRGRERLCRDRGRAVRVPAGTVRVRAAAGRVAASARAARADGALGFDLPADPAAERGARRTAWLREQLAARAIEAHAGRAGERFEAVLVVYEDGELEADLVIGVPPHRPPAVVAESALAGDDGWVSVDPGAVATALPACSPSAT
jgi:sulfide:quinone oxidoreductase